MKRINLLGDDATRNTAIEDVRDRCGSITAKHFVQEIRKWGNAYTEDGKPVPRETVMRHRNARRKRRGY